MKSTSRCCWNTVHSWAAASLSNCENTPTMRASSASSTGAGSCWMRASVASAPDTRASASMQAASASLSVFPSLPGGMPCLTFNALRHSPLSVSNKAAMPRHNASSGKSPVSGASQSVSAVIDESLFAAIRFSAAILPTTISCDCNFSSSTALARCKSSATKNENASPSLASAATTWPSHWSRRLSISTSNFCRRWVSLSK